MIVLSAVTLACAPARRCRVRYRLFGSILTIFICTITVVTELTRWRGGSRRVQPARRVPRPRRAVMIVMVDIMPRAPRKGGRLRVRYPDCCAEPRPKRCVGNVTPLTRTGSRCRGTHLLSSAPSAWQSERRHERHHERPERHHERRDGRPGVARSAVMSAVMSAQEAP
jgi:hypothetical protein